MIHSLERRLDTLPLAALPCAVVLTALILFAFLDASSFGVGSIERIAYAIVVCGALFAALASAGTGDVDVHGWRLMSFWLLAVALYAVATISQRDVYLSYVAGDVLSLLLPVLLIMAAWSAPRLYSDRSLTLLGIALLVAVLVGVAFGGSGQRFEPPTTLLIAITSGAFISARSGMRRVVLGGSLLLLGYLVLASGQRTALLIWLCCSFYAVWQTAYQPRWRIATVLFGIAIGSVLIGTAVRGLAVDVLSGYRAIAVTQGAGDASLLTRIAEGADVVATLTTEGNAMSWVIGFGHGATYEPGLSYVARNITAEGRVHNVHIGPLLLLFRYGLLGLVAYLSLIVSLLPVLARGLSPRRARTGDIFAFCVAAYLIEGLMFNVLVDPLFSYVLAGFLFHRWIDGR